MFEKVTDIEELKSKAKQLRRDVIVQVHAAASGHPGGSLSAADIVAALFFNIMDHDPGDHCWKDRDRFILSKGHCCPILYSALARTGYFDPEELLSFRKIGSRLQGHPGRRELPFVETSAGPLGQGLSVAVGICLGHRLDNNPAGVFCMLGDGELNEGQVWEAAMTAAHYRLGNLVAVIDNNGMQIDGLNMDVKNTAPLKGKFEAFGWKVLEVDGHDMAELLSVLAEAKSFAEGPVAVIAKTIKGKGVSFMENQVEWHGRPPNDEEKEKALGELA